MDYMKYWWVLLAVGLVMEFVADSLMRAPGTTWSEGRSGQKPWGNRERFTPAGYRVRIVGFVFTIAGIAVGVAGFSR